MDVRLRQPRKAELPFLSELCLRSKAVWGYGPDFLESCRAELTITETQFRDHDLVVAETDTGVVGIAQVWKDDTACYLEKLFVDPDYLKLGIGKRLYRWTLEAARKLGADTLLIEADPGAEDFYVHCGAQRIGTTFSGSIPGRTLPRLAHQLVAPVRA